MVEALDFGYEQVALAEEGSDGEFVGAGPLAQNTTGEVDGAQRQVGEQRSGEVHFPALGLDLDYAADD